MVTPISNDKILPSDANRSAVTEKKKADQGTTQQGAGSTTVSQDDNGIETSTVDVERANQIYSSSETQSASGIDSITSSEQAMAVAAEISAQIEAGSQQALKAQAGSVSNSVTALLEAVPA